MGKIVTPKHRVEYRDNCLALGWTAPDMVSRVDGRACYTQAWKGRATQEKLEAWRKAMNASFREGGSNAHIRPRDTVPHINMARIVNQSTGRVVAETTMPMFEAV